MIRSAIPVVALVAAGCAGPAPKEAALSGQAREEVTIAEVSVDVAPLGAGASGREMPAVEVDRVFERHAAETLLRGAGPRQTRAEVVLDRVYLITGGQALFLGGESIANGTVALVDIDTGEMVVQPRAISAGGGGWALGGVVGAATMDPREQEIEQLAAEFMDRARFALIGETQG